MVKHNDNNSLWTKLFKKGGNTMINGKRILIALDDGHGISTAGKRTPTLPQGQKSEIGLPYMNENLFNRAVVAYAKTELERNGFDVLLVAPTDADTPLESRTALANAKKADIYISVHANAISGKWGTWGGIETFYYPNPESRRLAQIMHKHVMKGTAFADRGLKNGSHLWVLRKTQMPAVLLELGFMDSLTDYDELLKDTYRKESAQEIAKATCEYFGVTYQPVKGATTPVSNPQPKPEPKPEPPVGRPTLRNGSSGIYVSRLQNHLIRHNIIVVADGKFGANTEAAVKKFQASKKLVPDGVVGAATWAEVIKDVKPVVKSDPKPEPKPVVKPTPTPTPAPKKPIAKNGDSGMAVKNVQTRLNIHGARLTVDGDFGTLTLRAVIAFQKLKKLEADGIVGDKTWAELSKNPFVEKPAPVPVVEQKPAPVAQPNDLNDGVLFRVVAGSFENMKDANERVTLLKTHGIKAFVSPFQDGGKTFYRVVAGTFDARQNAEDQKAKLEKLKISSFLLAVKK